MKKWYQENYFSRRNWILEHLSSLGLTAPQAIVLLVIDYKNEFRESITIESLSESTGVKQSQIDKIITDLCTMGYLKISSGKRISYDISGVFEKPDQTEVSNDIFTVFETEFNRPLSQKETTMIAEWVKTYGEKTVRKALREAIKYNKPNVDYIDRILVNGINDGKK